MTGGQCRRAVSKVSVHATHATHATSVPNELCATAAKISLQLLQGPCKACPLLSFVDLNGRKNTFDSKIMTPFCVPNHNIKTSYVGATYQVARFPAKGGWITALKRTNGALNHHYRTSLVGATNLVARCRCDLWFRATYHVAPTNRCFSKLCITLFVLLLRPMCPINSVPPPPKNPCNFSKDPVGATNLVARKTPLCASVAINPVPPPPKNPYAFFKDPVGATGGLCRRSVSTRPTRPIWSPAAAATRGLGRHGMSPLQIVALANFALLYLFYFCALCAQ